MKLTAFTHYSLRVLIYLAVQPAPRPTIAELALAFKSSENHLTKVVHFLGKQNWLTNARGRGGGVALARPPENIVVGHVIRDTEGPAGLAESIGQTGCDCDIAPNCQLLGALGQATAAFYAVLDGYTLADLVNGDHGAPATMLRLDGLTTEWPQEPPLGRGAA